jgi:hypothetical protein
VPFISKKFSLRHPIFANVWAERSHPRTAVTASRRIKNTTRALAVNNHNIKVTPVGTASNPRFLKLPCHLDRGLRAFVIAVSLHPLALVSQSPGSVTQANPGSVRRDPQALSVIKDAVSTLQGNSPAIPISSLRVKGTLEMQRVDKHIPTIAFTYDSLFTQYGAEFRRHTGAVSSSKVMVSNRGRNNSQSTGPHVPAGYYRYIFQPDYVPYAILANALNNPNIEVKYEGENPISGPNPGALRLSIATSEEGVGRTAFVRRWLIDPATHSPLESSVCLPTGPHAPCNLTVRDTYQSYQTIDGVISPTTVISQIAGRQTITYIINSIDLNPKFDLRHFTIEGVNSASN